MPLHLLNLTVSEKLFDFNLSLKWVLAQPIISNNYFLELSLCLPVEFAVRWQGSIGSPYCLTIMADFKT